MDLKTEVTNDGLLDAFVLAITTSSLTGEVKSLSGEWPEGDTGDPKDLLMEMVSAGLRE